MRFLSAFLLCLLCSPFALSQSETQPDSMPENVMKAEFKSLRNDSTIRFSEQKGKLVVGFLWTSWCGPCRLSVESLNALSKEFAARGVEVIGLTFDNPQTDARDVRKFIRQSKPKFRSFWMKVELAKELTHDKLIIPQFIVFTGDGVIIRRFVGYRMDATPARMREVIEQALATLPVKPD